MGVAGDVDVLGEHRAGYPAVGPDGICSFADYFVLCTGASQRTLGALAEEVLRRMKRGRRIVARGREGEAESGWILLDFGDVILHLFSQDLRDYYRLEDVWRTGRVVLRVQ
jgi:ribosome-associated protein